MLVTVNHTELGPDKRRIYIFLTCFGDGDFTKINAILKALL